MVHNDAPLTAIRRNENGEWVGRLTEEAQAVMGGEWIPLPYSRVVSAHEIEAAYPNVPVYAIDTCYKA